MINDAREAIHEVLRLLTDWERGFSHGHLFKRTAQFGDGRICLPEPLFASEVGQP